MEEIYIVTGNTADTEKYWYKIYSDIRNFGYKAYCVNPKIDEVDGVSIYPDFQSLPEKGTVLILVARPDVAAQFVEQALAAGGYKEIWFQPGSYDETAAAKAQNAGIEVHDDCFMLAHGIW
ncbi:MAG: CoA-binding protein [Elusimicrobiota bacterium]|jgi:predicted CoA-binding protein|nr:CoA-binding protein [Elusimicrobiota bacterium]